MNMLRLNQASHARLPAQLALNGTFEHTLRNNLGVSTTVQMLVLQCSHAVELTASSDQGHSCITLKRPACPERAARFIEGTINGVHTEATQPDEWDLVTEVESTLRRAVVMRQGTQQFTTDDDLDVEVISSPERTCIQVQDTRLCMALPTDPEAAYQQLHDLLQRFLSACRSTAQVA
ncbi:hypothetical protein ACFSB1_10820 [Halopseudomonas phragmitis]|uniref:Uncharacterized protein n=1 Tax=Halopseudomonas phragmitis TaxID=1931241 RepID=A0A1V0B9F9_9GAMM|nr:hypothetical protein [Halopseudomonas phragmitis]AQZ96576.1 hypothetical protein BVH74_18270 [Halopseudomonas phragmitis]